jgi:DNA-binding LytR/AlgR family response regulator
MLEIAICDDEPSQLALIHSYTTQFVLEQSIQASIHQFLHPDDLLRSCEKQRYHLYILDIVMPMLNGVEVGRTIRQYDQFAVILYTTSEPTFALQSFSTNPINYLLKPIDRQQFQSTLSLSVAKLNLPEESICTVKTHEGLQVIRFSEILYCEYSSHTVLFTLTEERKVVSKAMQGTFTQYLAYFLQDKRFIRPHASFLLNMDHIERFTKTHFILRSGHSVPIVTKKYGAVRDQYMDYLSTKRKG